MRWVVAPKMRCDLFFFAGVNLSGELTKVQVFAAGGRQGDVRGEDIKSMAIHGDHGVRVVLCASEDEETWQDSPWRAIRLKKGSTVPNREGTPAVRVPDIDWLDEPGARRNDPDIQVGYEEVASLGTGTEWTYGRTGPLKGRVRMIRVDKE